MLKKTIDTSLPFLLFVLFPALAMAQPTWTFDPFGKEKKPEKFENRKLGSEKTADKKFTVMRNFYQNNITHYNYYYNANNRVNMVIERAKISQKEDYSSLLRFYPYTLESTAAQKSELDSVIYTSTAGILLHDLRNDWVDNMYMLIGKAYFLRNDLDSALMTFQFINYNLFPRKRKNDDDDRVVGTNSAASGYKISIANKEKRNILQKVAALPPSRNDALIWLTRTLIEQDEIAESGGLINTLQNDPNLPNRLQNDLQEVTSYWFYKQGIYDSSAVHLEKALSNADTKQDRARWEFLLAQLYEMSGAYDKASDYYAKASKHTVDPLLDIYAQLNDAKMMKGAANPKELDKSISNLLKMGKRDKFESYRDIVYYSAGQLSLQKPDTNAAITYFNKSLKYNESNIPYKNRAYLQLGNIAYNRKQYRLAASMYDSLQTGSDSLMDKLIAKIQDRKNALTRIAEAISNIEREDSLQRLAAMQPAERDDYVKKLVKRLRKERGLKDDGSSGGDMLYSGNNSNQQPADLFAGNISKGEWYFANSSLKSRGFSEFKSKWGNRANLDNWRRKASIEKTAANNPAGGTNPTAGNAKDSANKNNQATEISYDALVKDIPLTEEKIAASNETIASNMVELAKAYQNDLEEYRLAANTYEDYLKRFPDRLLDGEIYLGLYYCYTKLEDKAKADYYKNLLNNKFPDSKSGQLLSNPAAANPTGKNPAVTKLYEDIYNLFIEGKYEQAMAEKKKADSLYGINYWTPQLLYIEALQHVKNREDSLAIKVLQSIIDNNPHSPLREKAVTMIDVLQRRAEIEKYLTSLEVTRAEDDKPVNVQDKPVPAVTNPAPLAPPKTDSIKTLPPPLTSGPFVMALTSPHHVLMILDKVDQVYVTEAKNAFTRYNRENYYGQPLNINKDVLDTDRSLLVITSFPDANTALQYYDKIKKSAASEVSWLPANKYSFVIITDENLQKLKSNKDVSGYKNLLNTQFPNRF